MKSWSILFVLLFLLVATTSVYAAPAAGSAPSARGIPVIVEPVVEPPDDLFKIVRSPSKPLLVRCPMGASPNSSGKRCVWP
jgi:hypothetical protein